MWTKLTQLQQLLQLKRGHILIKYPLSGEPEDDLVQAGNKNAHVMIVTAKDDEAGILKMEPALKQEEEHGHIHYENYKRYTELLSEKLWWADL